MHDSEISRVRVLEPLRDRPAVEMPVFGRLLGTMRGVRGLLLLVTGVLAWRLPWSIPWKALAELARKESFRELSLPPEGLFAVGAKAYFKLPGTEVAWAEARLPKPALLQLRAQRRVWLLGPDEKGRRFLQQPGVLWPRRVRTVTAPPDGAARLDAVEQRRVPPEEDVVLIAHRRRVVRGICSLFAAVEITLVLLVAIQIYAIAEGIIDEMAGVIVLSIFAMVFFVLGIEAAKDIVKPLSRGKWTEMVAVPHGPPLIGASGLATLACRVQWSNGWWSDVHLSKVDPSLVANILATQRLWIIGEPFRGTATFAGVPGHAVLGRVKFN
ncbi:hypothetical protein ACFQ05_13235 [Amycolatopsis umgeniensis]|uniref:Uncharacterized protein n=1 Tax=Amycolatopsis umgeniensis TaxID=336628 RepID=A0A841B4M6_9PSEU|nr:hypothetical protein [Amycolatopsis umgeniensis]MBB5854267.1 hypothetical protein [Amycolatopsis umgeniensis]